METTVGYKFLPHTTDAYVEAVGMNIEEAFTYAAIALIDTMCNAASVACSLNEEMHVEGSDEIILLYNWLELLLLKFDLEEKVFSTFAALRITPQDSKLTLDTTASGEKYDRLKHGAKLEVKAVTLHRMEILRKEPLTIAHFILDL